MKKAMQKYIGWGATIIITGAVTIAIFFCIFKFNGLAAGIGKLVNILMPIIIGIGIAYVLSAPRIVVSIAKMPAQRTAFRLRQ